jgi:hypothetical protein
MHFHRWLGPIDFGMLIAAGRVVARFGFVLTDARWISSFEDDTPRERYASDMINLRIILNAKCRMHNAE